jgi:hypothetical protein
MEPDHSVWRREFIVAFAGALAGVARLAAAQGRVPHLAFLWLGTAGTGGDTLRGLLSGLRDLGYQEGRNLVIDYYKEPCARRWHWRRSSHPSPSRPPRLIAASATACWVMRCICSASRPLHVSISSACLPTMRRRLLAQRRCATSSINERWRAASLRASGGYRDIPTRRCRLRAMSPMTNARGDALALCQMLWQGACPIGLLVVDLAAVEELVSDLIELSVRHDWHFWHAFGSCFRGVLTVQRGDLAVGPQLLEEALRGLRSIDFGVHYLYFLCEYTSASRRSSLRSARAIACSLVHRRGAVDQEPVAASSAEIRGRGRRIRDRARMGGAAGRIVLVAADRHRRGPAVAGHGPRQRGACGTGSRVRPLYRGVRQRRPSKRPCGASGSRSGSGQPPANVSSLSPRAPA